MLTCLHSALRVSKRVCAEVTTSNRIIVSHVNGAYHLSCPTKSGETTIDTTTEVRHGVRKGAVK